MSTTVRPPRPLGVGDLAYCAAMGAPLIYYKPCTIGDTYFRECLTCGAIVKNEGLHTLYHEQQTSPKRCPKCGLLDIGRHICPKAD